MVMDLWGRWRGSVVLLCALRAACLLAQTDTDAITFPVPTNGSFPALGYLNDGVGWSFVPSTNLLATWVGCYGFPSLVSWPTNTEITFWTSPTTPLATYSAGQIATPLDWDTNGVAYGQVSPLRLTAGKKYYITEQHYVIEAGGVDPTLIIEVYQNYGDTSLDNPWAPFQLAAELTYLGVYDGGLVNGSLRPDSVQTFFLILGPTFRFQVLPGPFIKRLV